MSNNSKMYKIELYLLWQTNNKSYMIYRMAPSSTSLNHSTPTLDFKVMSLFNAEYLRNTTRYRHSFDGILIGTYALLKGVISNDLELLSKIFNDTKCRTVSLRHLSYLLLIMLQGSVSANVR